MVWLNQVVYNDIFDMVKHITHNCIIKLYLISKVVVKLKQCLRALHCVKEEILGDDELNMRMRIDNINEQPNLNDEGNVQLHFSMELIHMYDDKDIFDEEDVFKDDEEDQD